MRRFAAAAAALAVLLPAAAARADFAQLDRPGPALTTKAKVTCTAGVDGATRTPVLLNPATGVTVQQNFEWNWQRSLTALGIPWCAYDAPQQTLGDIQTSGELLVDAIRTVHARAGRRIAILGHSQGGMSMRWALRFWPDTRAMVDDVIGFAGSNHGTTLLSTGGCAQNGCTPASIQQAADSRFIQALNSRAETFAGISYTNVYTRTDEVVLPPTSSALRTGAGAITNIPTQAACPAALYEHLTVGTVDPVAYALGVDALTHDGPADPRRLPGSVCAQLYQPGVDPLSASQYVTILSALPGLASVSVPGVSLAPGATLVKTEPALRCYTQEAGCPGQATTATPQCTSKRSFTIRLQRGIRGARVSLNGRKVKTRRSKGRVVATIDLRGRGSKRVTVRVRGRKGAKRVGEVRRYRPCTARRAQRAGRA